MRNQEGSQLDSAIQGYQQSKDKFSVDKALIIVHEKGSDKFISM